MGRNPNRMDLYFTYTYSKDYCFKRDKEGHWYYTLYDPQSFNPLLVNWRKYDAMWYQSFEDELLNGLLEKIPNGT